MCKILLINGRFFFFMKYSIVLNGDVSLSKYHEKYVLQLHYTGIFLEGEGRGLAS